MFEAADFTNVNEHAESIFLRRITERNSFQALFHEGYARFHLVPSLESSNNTPCSSRLLRISSARA